MVEGCARAAPHNLTPNHAQASCVISHALNGFRFISSRKSYLRGGKSSCVTQRVSEVYLKTVQSLAVAGSTKHQVEDHDLFYPGAWSCLPTGFLKTQLNMKTSMAENKRCEALLIRWKDMAGSYFTNAYQFCLTPLWRALMRKKCWLKCISALDEVAVIWKGHTTHHSRREPTWLNNLKNRNCCGLVLLQYVTQPFKSFSQETHFFFFFYFFFFQKFPLPPPKNIHTWGFYRYYTGCMKQGELSVFGVF